MNNKFYVEWHDVDIFIDELANKLRDTNCSGVYGLPRGGLILAVMLSHRLHIPLLSAPCDKCIIIDDICDSGESLLHYTRNTSGPRPKDFTICTMFASDNDLNISPDYYKFEKAGRWIVFPWENKED